MSSVFLPLRVSPTRFARAYLLVFLMVALLVVGGLPAAAATVYSYTGTLASSTDVFEQTFVLSSVSNVTVETFGFGGGTNGSGTAIPAGGFDSLIALFSGPVATASILTDGLGNAVAQADTLSTFNGGNCPPAGQVNVGGPICGDAYLQALNLPAGTYTLLLSDAGNIPSAVSPGPPSSSLLSDGFTDLTGGAFQTCNGETCITTTANYAVDLITQSTAAVPEPGSAASGGIAALAFLRFRKRLARGAWRAKLKVSQKHG